MFPLAVAACVLLAFHTPTAPAQTQASGGAASHSAPAKSQANPAQADELFAEMSRITGLPVKAPLKTQVITRPEVEKYLGETLHAEYTPQELHAQQATLVAFGLVERDFDLEKFLIRFYTEQAAGIYDPRRKTMYIADWPPEEMQRLVLAHELTHALQDQNFDLEKFLHARRDDDDATNARQALAEGHAMAAMLQQILQPAKLTSFPSLEPLMAGIIHQQMQEFPVFSEAPYFFRLQALFPYAQGMGFIERGLTLGGWEKLSSIFLNPPASTKEIFQPEVYFEHKPLPKISLPRPTPLAGANDFHLLTENVMGELGYYALLGQFISENEGKSVARGWLADHYILYEGPKAGEYLLIARTRWSSPDTARAFFRDDQTILARKYPDLSQPPGLAQTFSGARLEMISDQHPVDPKGLRRPVSGTAPREDEFLGTAAGGRVILLRKGDEVLWAEGVPPSLAEAMAAWLGSL